MFIDNLSDNDAEFLREAWRMSDGDMDENLWPHDGS